jgi:iron complex outermembrane recepter protein
MKSLIFFLLLIPGIGAFAQLKISGKVYSAENEPLPGASIIIEGTTIGTVSAVNGFFLLNNLKTGNYSLKVSFIGYQSYSTNVTLTKDVSLEVVLQKTEVMTDEVFVYATRAGSRTPVATSEISKLQIESKNMGQDVPFLLNSTPSFVSSSDAGAGVGYTGFHIRGTDANRINVTINGIPFNEAESHDVYWVDLPDILSSIENIQIQRGVGTSTQGAAAFGATINMQTSALRKNAYAEYSGSAGSFNTLKNTFRTGTGLLNNHFSFDARLSAISSDGFIDRAFSKLNSYYLSGGYYSDNTIVKLITFSGKEKTYQAWNGIPSVRLNSDIEGMKRYEEHGLYSLDETEAMLASNPRTYNLYNYDNQTDNYRQDHYQLLLNQKFGAYIHLNAALHLTHGEGYYEEYKADDQFSEYGLPNVIAGNDTIASSNLVRQKWLDNNFYGGTFSFNYMKENSDFTLGAGWNEYDGQHFGKIIWAQYMGETPKDYEWYRGNGIKTDFNVYAKYNYSFSDKLNLYADLQYRNINHSIDGKDDDLRDLTQDHNYDFFNPKLGIYYQPNNQSKMYLSWAVAHREPNRSNFTDADPKGKQPIFETLNDFEGGYNFQSTSFSAGANIYFMDYKNQLILTGEINDVGSAIMTNVEDSYRAGIEIVAGVKILPTLTWNVNATFSQNKILNFTEYVDTYSSEWEQLTLSTFKLGTTDIAFSPTIIANSIIRYEPVTKLEINLISQYVGKQYIDNSSSEDRKLDAYFVSNLKVSYSIKPEFINEVEFNLLVPNLFNEKYETNGWVWSYIYGGARYKMDGYFPQAGTNFVVGVDIKF